MKKTIALLLCLMLALVSVLSFASCGGDTETPADTKEESAADTSSESKTEDTAAVDSDTEAVGDETDTPADDTVAPGQDETGGADDNETTPGGEENPADTGDGETTDEGGNDDQTDGYDPEQYVLIRTAEDLMAFNAAVNDPDGEVDYSFMTVLFMDDIDMTGYEWTPLDGYWLEDVIFDGQGHTISNLKFVDHTNQGLPLGDQGSGFIGVNYFKNTFKDITFKDASVTASASHVGCIIGTNRCEYGDDVIFENVHVDGFVADGMLEGIGNTIRVGGFIGSNNAGYPVFTNCSAKNLKLSGFHNLCGFVGYDHTGGVDENSFTGCAVENCEFTFSYCQSDSYTADMPRKFVQVFYCATNWADNLDYVVARGNTFSDVYFYDWTDDNQEYRAEEFRSWTREEAAAAAAAG